MARMNNWQPDRSPVKPRFFVLGRRSSRVGLAAIALTLQSLMLGMVNTQVARAEAPTVVSLTFDDGYADQMPAARQMNALGLRGTFYTPSGFVGQNGYMSQAEMHQLVASGNEIGGHTVTHPHLTAASADEVKREICEDRRNLTGWGFRVTSFAYPYAAIDAQAETEAKACGYNSARGLDDVQTRFSCPGCALSESIPPSNPFHTAAPQDVHNYWALQDMKDAVLNARGTAGWVQLTFHHIGGDTADPLNATPRLFGDFTRWLSGLQAKGAVVVKTVDEVIGGPVRPLAVAPAAPGPVDSGNALRNPGMENPGPEGLPKCWLVDAYGSNTNVATTVSPGHLGRRAAKLVVTGYQSGDAKLAPAMDLGGCSPAVEEGQTYELSAWYKSTAPTRITVFYRSGVGYWKYWTESPSYGAASAFTKAQWVTPAVPAGATAISYGLSLKNNGQIITDDYSMRRVQVVSRNASTGGLDPRLFDGIGWLGIIAGVLAGGVAWHSTRKLYNLVRAHLGVGRQ